MTFEECIPHLIAGREIRRTSWNHYEGLYMSGKREYDYLLFNKDATNIYMEDLTANDWEVI